VYCQIAKSSQDVPRDCRDSKGEKGMSKIITDRRNSLTVVIEACRIKILRGYPNKVVYAAHRRRQCIKGGNGATVSSHNPQPSASQSINPLNEQSTTSDSLTMRAIQAFMDTEDEWAEVYANLAKS
jgi:hypothetical protein